MADEKNKITPMALDDVMGTYTENPFTQDGLTPSTDYKVAIKVTDKIGKNSTSDPVEFTTLPPSPVIDLFRVDGVDPKQNCIEVTYQLTVEGGFDRVRVYANDRYVGNSSTAIDNGDGTFTITVTTLNPNTTYDIYIEVYDLVGQMTKSDPITYTTYPVVPLISNVNLKLGQTEIEVDVEASSQLGYISKYVYTYNKVGDPSSPEYESTVNPFTISGLELDTDYELRIQAVDVYDQRGNMWTATFRTYPTAPVIDSIDVTDITQTGATLTVNATSVAGIKRYIFQYGLTVSTVDNTYTISGDLQPYIDYDVTVTVEDIFGQQTVQIVSFKTIPYPMVFNSYAVSDVVQNGAMFTVDIIGNNDLPITAPLTKVEFYDGSTKLFEYNGSDFSFYISDLMPGTTYNITKAIAYDEFGQTAENTDTQSFETIPSELVIDSVEVSNITDKTADIVVSYTSEAEVVKFEYSVDNGATWIEVETSVFTATNLVPNTDQNMIIKITDIYRQESTFTTLFKTDEEQFFISFDSQGGTEFESFWIYKNETIDLNDYIPELYANAFDGWYIDSTKYEGTIIVLSDMPLVAHWIEIKPVVKFLDWDGTVLKTETLNYGDSATPPADPTRTGYNFAGWDSTFEFITDNKEINALYDAIDYYLLFDSVAGISEQTSKVVHYNEAVGELPIPTIEQGNFVEWNTKIDGTGDTYTETTIYQIADDLTLYAIYDSKAVVTMSGLQTNSSDYIGTIGISEFTKDYDTSRITLTSVSDKTVNFIVTAGTYTSSANYFHKMIALPAGSYTVNRTYLIENMDDDYQTLKLGELVLTDESEGIDYATIDYITDSSGNGQTTFVLDVDTTINVKLFLIESSVTVTSAFLMSFRLELLKQERKVTFYNTGDTINIDAPITLGATFDGWYYDIGFTQPWVDGTVMGNSSFYLYAKLTASQTKINFDFNGGTNNYNFKASMVNYEDENIKVINDALIIMKDGTDGSTIQEVHSTVPLIMEGEFKANRKYRIFMGEAGYMLSFHIVPETEIKYLDSTGTWNDYTIDYQNIGTFGYFDITFPTDVSQIQIFKDAFDLYYNTVENASGSNLYSFMAVDMSTGRTGGTLINEDFVWADNGGESLSFNSSKQIITTATQTDPIVSDNFIIKATSGVTFKVGYTYRFEMQKNSDDFQLGLTPLSFCTGDFPDSVVVGFWDETETTYSYVFTIDEAPINSPAEFYFGFYPADWVFNNPVANKAYVSPKLYEVDDLTSIEVNYLDSLPELPNAVSTVGEFLGWFDKSDNTSLIEFTKGQIWSDNLNTYTMYAKYLLSESVIISYDNLPTFPVWAYNTNSSGGITGNPIEASYDNINFSYSQDSGTRVFRQTRIGTGQPQIPVIKVIGGAVPYRKYTFRNNYSKGQGIENTYVIFDYDGIYAGGVNASSPNDTIIDGSNVYTVPNGTVTRDMYISLPLETGTSGTNKSYVANNLIVTFEDKESLLIFDNNGGDGGTNRKTVTYGKPVGELPAPTRTNYELSGWLDLSKGIYYTSDTIFNEFDNVVLTAQWTPVQGQLVFNANGGSVSPTTKTTTYGQVVGTLPTPTRTSYLFTGWKDDNGVTWTASTVWTLGSVSVSLTAQWSLGTIVYQPSIMTSAILGGRNANNGFISDGLPFAKVYSANSLYSSEIMDGSQFYSPMLKLGALFTPNRQLKFITDDTSEMLTYELYAQSSTLGSVMLGTIYVIKGSVTSITLQSTTGVVNGANLYLSLAYTNNSVSGHNNVLKQLTVAYQN